MPRPHIKLPLWWSRAQSNKHNSDFILKLPIIQWNQRCHVAVGVTKWTPYVIYTTYINISEGQKKTLLLICLRLFTKACGTHPLQTFQKEYTIRHQRLLCTFSAAAKMHKKVWENKTSSDNQMCFYRERCTCKINTRRHIQCEKTAGLYMELTWWQHHAVCTWESCLTQQLWPAGH